MPNEPKSTKSNQPSDDSAKLRPAVARDVIGSSGHVPRLEEINPGALDEHTGSSGADADREAAKE